MAEIEEILSNAQPQPKKSVAHKKNECSNLFRCNLFRCPNINKAKSPEERGCVENANQLEVWYRF